MNWFGHEYLVPIIIGNGRKEKAAAKAIKSVLGLEPTIFAEKFSFGQRFSANCRRIVPFKDHILLLCLQEFYDGLEEYKFPILIYGDDFKEFVISNTEDLESRFVICNTDLAIKLIYEAEI